MVATYDSTAFYDSIALYDQGEVSVSYSYEIPESLNILAGTSGLDAQGAANAYAGTTGRDLLSALNAKYYASTTWTPSQSQPSLDLNAVCNALNSSTGLEAKSALSKLAGGA